MDFLRPLFLLPICIVFGIVFWQPTFLTASETEVESLYDELDIVDAAIEKRQKKQLRSKKAVLRSEGGVIYNLEPFEDVVVIQKKFLPKTQRFDVNLSLSAGLNNAFFTNFGFVGKGSYYLSEKWGVELVYAQLSSDARDVTDGLRENQYIDTKTLVVAESYMGAHVKWVPVYGKMSFLNQKIVPFDVYLSSGLGITKTQSGDSALTISASIGQLFAWDKWKALQWSFSWNLYQADEVNSLGQKTSGLQNDFIISAGMTFFFPEAKYR